MNLDLCINYDTTTTNKVINLHITSKDPFSPTALFLMIRTLGMRRLLNKVLSVQYSIVNYGCYAAQQISETYSYCITVILYPLNDSPFSPPLSPAATILSCFHDFDYFRYLIYVESWYLPFWDWHFTWHSISSPSILLQKAEYFFLFCDKAE